MKLLVRLPLLYELIISIFDLEQWLAIFNGELGDDGARVENTPVPHDVMAVGLPENSPKFEASVEGLVSRPDASLHRKILSGVTVVIWALDFIGVPDVPVVSFDSLSWLEKVRELVHEDLDVRPGAGGVGSADPDQIPRENINAELISQG